MLALTSIVSASVEIRNSLPTRTIPCSVEGCSAKFIRHHDLEKQLQKGHRELQKDTIDPQLQGAVGKDEPIM